MGGGQDAAVAHQVGARRWDGSGQPAEQRERVEVDGDGAVGEGALQFDTDEATRELGHALFGERRAKDVFAESFSRAGIVGGSCGGGVQREPALPRGQA